MAHMANLASFVLYGSSSGSSRASPFTFVSSNQCVRLQVLRAC
jgi:hypothetical protein